MRGRNPICSLGALALYFCILLLTGCSIELLTAARFLDFDFNGPMVKMSSDGSHRSLDITPYAAARGDFGYQVLLVTRTNGFIYAVLEVSGRSPGTNSVCTNGVEKNVVWFKLNRKLETQDIKSVLVESCSQNIHNASGCVVVDERLAVSYVRETADDRGDSVGSLKRQSVLHYDNHRPGDGLVIAEHESEVK